MPLTERIRVLVLHRDPLAEAGLSVAFNNRPDFEIQRDTESRQTYSADVVIADYCQGVRLAGQIARRGNTLGGPKVVVVAGIDREWEVRSALELGVRGYLMVGCTLDELVEGVRVVHRGARHLSRQAAARLAESVAREPLTSREEEVLRLVVEGLCNKAIGRRLGIAVGTVKSHLKSTFDKLNVESRTHAIATAERRGLLGQAPERENEDINLESGRSSHWFHDPCNSFREHLDEHAMSSMGLQQG
jgi:DNA-binding NarL/FixJ family response regulator